MTATVMLDDRALRAKLVQVLVKAGINAGTKMAGYVQQKINVSARIETPAGRRARIKSRKARGLKFAKHRYQGSAPGEPPRSRTRTLIKSITSETIWYNVGREVVTTRVGSNVPYARHLEFGTKKMAARPFLRPSLTEFAPRFRSEVNASIARSIRAGGLS